MPAKNRNELKSYFVKNAIPTEGNFADLIDSQLNQAVDGIFKLEGEPLSIVAAVSQQKRTLRLYSDYPAANPDWMICLNPAQDPANAATSRPGLGFTDGAGNTRLFIDAAAGKVGVGTNTPAEKLHVAGRIHAVGDLISVGPDAFEVGPNRGAMAWGPYGTNNQGALVLTSWTNAGGNPRHQEVGIHGSRIFFGAGPNVSFTSQLASIASPLSVGGALTIGGAATIGGKLNAGGYGGTAGSVNAATMEIGGPNPVPNGSGGGILYLHHHNVIAHQLRYNSGTLYFEAAGNGYGSSGRPTLALNGDVSLEGKHAFRGNDSWLRLNQDGAFASGVHTPGNFAPMSLNVGGVGGWGNPGQGNAWISGTLSVNGGVVSAGLNLGRNGATTTYSWPYETIGTDSTGHNLRLASRNAVYFHAATGVVVGTDQGGNGWLRANAGLHAAGNAGVLNLEGVNHCYIQWYPQGGGAGRKGWIGYGGAGTNVMAVSNDIGPVQINQVSDISLKENVAELSGLLDRVAQLRPVSFDWKGSALSDIGFVAQDVEPVFPELVSETKGPDDRPLKSLSQTSFSVLAIGAIKEMKRRYDERIEALEKQVRELQGVRG